VEFKTILKVIVRHGVHLFIGLWSNRLWKRHMNT